MQITFVVAVNSRRVLQQNLLASPDVGPPHEILIQEGFPSAALAYNDALRKAANDLIVFIHQDVFLPKLWLSRLEVSLQYLRRADPSWGVLGCWGARVDGTLVGQIYSSGWGILGSALSHPVRVQTLDEVVLIVKRSSGLFFDECLPHFHFYGADICMRASTQGLNCYALPCFCVHNTRQLLRLPKEFYDCYTHVKRVWKDRLPIQTSCIRISRFNIEVIRRKLEDFCHPAFLDKRTAASRVPDPTQILKEHEYNG
jgi:Glycosyltransferase like family